MGRLVGLGLGTSSSLAGVQGLVFLPQLPSPAALAGAGMQGAAAAHGGAASHDAHASDPHAALAALLHAGGARMLLFAQVRWMRAIDAWGCTATHMLAAVCGPWLNVWVLLCATLRMLPGV